MIKGSKVKLGSHKLGGELINIMLLTNRAKLKEREIILSKTNKGN